MNISKSLVHPVSLPVHKVDSLLASGQLLPHHHEHGDYQQVPVPGEEGTVGSALLEGEDAGSLLLYKKLTALAAGAGCMSVLAIWG